MYKLDSDALMRWWYYNVEVLDAGKLEDILNGYMGTFHDKEGRVHTYEGLRQNFIIEVLDND